jgi:meiosis arrest female protein 1
LQADEKGVSVEHLVTWVQGVILKSSPNGGCAKMLTWGNKETNYYHISSTASEDSSSSDIAQALPERSTSPSYLAAQVNLFGREIVELLRASTNCQIPFVKFIPAYHHHFGRQCRVSGYGYTKLVELLDALPHVVQVSYAIIIQPDTKLMPLAN